MYRLRVVTIALLCACPAAALAEPEDITISGMIDHEGQQVVGDLSGAYVDLIRELGTVVANKPLAPGETLGAYGFDLAVANTFAFVTTEGEDGPSAWQRANVDEDVGAYLFVPQISARKGLPMSFEVGAHAGWMGLSNQGIFGGYGRLGLVEGYKPYPDITVQVGYSGYVGNDELELGVLDAGVSLGSTFPFGSFPGINNARFSPFVNYTMLRVSAHPTIDAEVAEQIGAKPLKGTVATDDTDAALVIPQLAGGFQVTNGTVLFRLVGTWSPKSIPTATVGMGFTY